MSESVKQATSESGVDIFDLDDADRADRSRRRVKKSSNIYTGWLFMNGKFVPNRDITDKLKSGVYGIEYDSNVGFYLSAVELNDEPLIYDNKHMQEIMAYVNIFWDSAEKFVKYSVGHKRGLLLHGLPGTGKSCIMRAVALETIRRDGIVFLLRSGSNARVSLSSVPGVIASVRKTEPSRMIVICIEDIEGYLERHESDLINLIDGADSIGNVMYIATTNFVKRLPRRLTRPSRFDNIIEVLPPNKRERIVYLKHLGKNNGGEVLPEWYNKTENMTYAELKELFIAVNVFGKKPDDVRKQFKKEYGQEVA